MTPTQYEQLHDYHDTAAPAVADGETASFWETYHLREAEREARAAIRLGLECGFHGQAYKSARRAAKEAFMVLKYRGEDPRDESPDERAAKEARTRCGECGQEVI